MIRCLKINDNLYLSEEEIPKPNIEISETANHIWIYDRSISMYYLLPELIKNMIDRAKQIPIGDTITLGWFSSEGEYNFIIKGFKVTEDRDYAILENAILGNSSAIGMTCFSEILQETVDNVINDLLVFSDRFSLTFFTDGYPVVSNQKKEKQNIFKAIKKLEGNITSALFVGYGNYYNKELMSEMSQAIGGSLVHSSNLTDFNVALSKFIEVSIDSGYKINVPIAKYSLNSLFFSVNKNCVNVFSTNDKQQSINFPFVKSKEKNYLYSLSSNFPNDNVEFINLTDGNVGQNTKIEHFIKGVYACIYILCQKAKVDVALELLAKLGDVSIIKAVTNSYTNDEYGKVESHILECISSQKKRFLNGRNTNYIPNEDAFCVLDAIEALCSDKNAYLYPSHPDFKYRRIGVASVPKDGYPSFEADINNSCPFSSIVWNDSLLNLSVQTKLNGKVKLDKKYKKYEFSNNYFDTFVWRNYAIVKDGFLNVDKLPISISEMTFNLFKLCELLNFDEKYEENKIYTIDLSKLPIMNRKTAKGNTSALKFFKLKIAELNCKSSIKVYKFLKDELLPEKPLEIFSGLTEEQVEYLNSLGVTAKGFNPPTEQVASLDSYYAKEFIIGLKGLNSLPSVKDVRMKLVIGKKLTKREELLEQPLKKFTDETNGMCDSNKIIWLDHNIGVLKKQLIILRNSIQKSKFSIILGKKWFDEFNSRENCSIDIDGITCTIELKNKEIKI